MRIIVSAGGTGGHIHPLLVVAEEFRKLNHTLLFIGGLYGPEGDKARATGFEFLGLNVRGLDSSNIFSMLKALAIFPYAVAKALRAFSVFQPHAVVGAGGYASAPASVAALLKGVPLFLMEQNVYPGIVTRRLSREARRVFTSFQESARWLKGADVFFTGNPVREGFGFGIKDITRRGEKVLLVMGGSQGAHSINSAMAEALPHLKDISLKIYHQTGPREYERMKEFYGKYRINSVVQPFFENVNEIMRKAHLAVARAGASTCAELAVSGLPALLVPFPGAGGHQKLNARALCDNGAAVMVEDSELDGEMLANTIQDLIGNDERLERMSANSRGMARPDAGKEISREIIRMLET